MKKFYLITNVSNRTYWSYMATDADVNNNLLLLPMHVEAVRKYGNIFINQAGGWMPATCAVTIHRTVTQKEFPVGI